MEHEPETQFVSSKPDVTTYLPASEFGKPAPRDRRILDVLSNDRGLQIYLVGVAIAFGMNWSLAGIRFATFFVDGRETVETIFHVALWSLLSWVNVGWLVMEALQSIIHVPG